MEYSCELKLKDESNEEKLDFRTGNKPNNISIHLMSKENAGAEMIPPLTIKFMYISSLSNDNKYTLNNAIEFSGIVIDGTNNNISIVANGVFDTKGLIMV